MIGKIFALLVLTLMVGTNLASAAQATTGNIVIGEGDYYKVIIDERGQAIVIEELNFKNYGRGNENLSRMERYRKCR